MRIAIDMQGAQTESRFRGIGRYSLAFAQAIARNRENHDVVLVASDLFPETIEPIRAAFDGLLSQRDIHVWSAPGPVREATPGNEKRRISAELIREGFFMSLEPDVIHITSIFEGYADDAVTSIGRLDSSTPVSVSLYDLIPLLHPDDYLAPNPPYEHYYRDKMAQLQRASLLLAISESSRHEALDHLEGLACEVVNVSTAVSGNFRPNPMTQAQLRELKKTCGIHGDFVLYTGGADQRKNLARLIKAYACLAAPLRSNLQLVFAGMMPEPVIQQLRTEAASAGLSQNSVVFTGYVSDDRLISLYSACRAFVFPSWHEGFGLPALEAMQCGAPAIGANASSVPEVIGRADALFDPFDVNSICRKMAQVLDDSSFRSSLATHGLQRAKRFSWDKTAQSAIAAFERLRASRRKSVTEGAARVVPQVVEAVAACCAADSSDTDLTLISSAIAKIRSPGRGPQLFVDVSELSQRDAKTGIQRVTRSILKALLECPPDGFTVKPVYATTDVPGYRYSHAFAAKRQADTPGRELDLPIDYGAGDVFLGLDLQHHVVRAQQPYLEAVRRNGVLVTFVVYDLLPILLPAAFQPGADAGHKAWLDVIARFDGALCISNAVATELEAWLRQHPAPRLRPFTIRAFPLGTDLRDLDPVSRPSEPAEGFFAQLDAHPSFLTVGTVEPRKGHEQILRAFELLWQQGVLLNLVIVGKEGWMVSDLCDELRRHPELGKQLFWFDEIRDAELGHLYATCTCLIAASEGEGFGLPLIEAAQHGLPIIAREIPVFREVAGAHAFYFEGKAPGDLAVRISQWLEHHRAGRHPKSQHIRVLTWKDSSASLISAVLAMRAQPRDTGFLNRFACSIKTF